VLHDDRTNINSFARKNRKQKEVREKEMVYIVYGVVLRACICTYGARPIHVANVALAQTLQCQSILLCLLHTSGELSSLLFVSVHSLLKSIMDTTSSF